LHHDSSSSVITNQFNGAAPDERPQIDSAKNANVLVRARADTKKSGKQGQVGEIRHAASDKKKAELNVTISLFLIRTRDFKS
jgi:hypothetical protein